MPKTGKHNAEAVLRDTARGIEMEVFVLPRSSRCGIMGVHDRGLKVKLTAAPVEGRANEQCCHLLAKELGIAKTRIAVIHGKSSRRKVLLIEGLTRDQVLERLLKILPEG